MPRMDPSEMASPVRHLRGCCSVVVVSVMVWYVSIVVCRRGRGSHGL